jgi:hypothetical protein
MKKIFVIIMIPLFLITKKGASQEAVVDVAGNAIAYSQLLNALEMLKQAKDAIEQARQTYQTIKYMAGEARKTAELLQAVADDKVDFTLISDLSFSNGKDFLKKVLCIDPNDFVPQNAEYIKIIATFKSGIGECSNFNNYINTYAGIEYKMSEGYYGTSDNYRGKLTALNNDLKAAENQAKTFQIVNDRTKLEIGYKYLDISEELVKKTDELSKALDSDSLKVSRAERLQLKLTCTDFQLKAMDYKLKGMGLISESSQYSNLQQNSIESQKVKIAMDSWIRLSK